MKTQHDKIHQRQQKQKILFLENYQKMPVVQIVCERIGIGRTTFYRWQKEDALFYQQVLDAERLGRDRMNDAMESALIQAAKQGNITAIIFYLKYNHPRYSDSWDAIKPQDIREIVEYLKYSTDDYEKDKEFISKLFERRLPYRLAKQVLQTMKQLKNMQYKKIEEKKIDLLHQLKIESNNH